MKIIITDTTGVVLSKADTNITDPNETSLISVGCCSVHLVEDTDAHEVGDVFDLAVNVAQPAQPAPVV